MTEIKTGFIGKLNMVHDKVRNPYDLQGQIVVVTEVKGDSYSILNESLNCILQIQDFEVKSTRLKPELREGLKTLFKHYSNLKKIQQQIQELNVEARNTQILLYKEQEKMQVQSSTVTTGNIGKIIPSIYSTKFEKDEITISIGFEQCIDKYVRENDYSFIMNEYDNTLEIYSVDAAIKEVGLDIKRFASNVNAIKEAAKNSKGIKFLGISDNVWIGDKNTLHVSKLINFSIKRSVTTENLKDAFEPINKQIEIMDNHFISAY